MRFSRKIVAAAVTSCVLGLMGNAASALTIAINPNASLAGNAPALAAFQRAANQWQTRLSDPILVTIDAGLTPLGTGIIGNTGTVDLEAPFDTIRNQMVADAADEGVDDAVVAFLPTNATFSAFQAPGRTLTGNLGTSKANLKAMGFTGLDATFGVSDATINFSTSFTFDFDNSNGVTAGTLDFETVAAHEIGHALGFFSSVDDVNAGSLSITPTPLDLFRFRDNTLGSDPLSFADFAIATRDLIPGQTDIFDDTTREYLVSTGLASVFQNVDGFQASHWKDDGLTGQYIGIMDPSLAAGAVEQITLADLRAMDVIGYEVVALPEPTTLAGLAIGGLLLRRRRA